MNAFWEVFRFELEYRLRRVSTWIYAGLLLLVPFLLLHAINGADSRLNSPHSVFTATFISGLVGMLVTAALFGDAATRDFQTGMHPLIYSTPVRTVQYLGGRFLAALALNAVLLLGIPLGQVLGAAMPYMDPKMFGPFQLAAYAQPYLLLLLPNLLLTGAVLFALCLLTRQVLPAFLGSIGIFVLYLFTRDFRERIGDPTLRALSDPFGISVVDEIKRYWTPVELDSQTIGFHPALVANRLLWMAAAAGLLLVLLRRFRFTHPAGGSRRRGRRAVREPQAAPRGPVTIPAVPRSFGAGARLRQTLAVTRRSLEEIAGNRAFAVLLAGAVALTFLFGWNVGDEVFGTSTWPVTHLVAGTVLAQLVSPVVVLLIAVYAGELVWKEREVRMSAISDAAPVPDGVLMLGRFLALVAMVAAIQLVLMGSGIALQAVQGWHHFEPGLYLRILFGIRLVDYVLIAALAIAVHVIVNQKYMGHLIVVLVYAFTLLARQFGIHHHLLIYGTGPGWMYSDMSGFGPFASPTLWFQLYWAAWALLLAVIARLFWVRGRDREVRGSMAVARMGLTRGVARSAAVAAMLVLALGGFVFYNTNVLNHYRSPWEQAEAQAEYERRYKRFESLPQPRVTHAELRIEIHPAAPAAELRGTFTLRNDGARPIEALHVNLDPEVRARSLEIDRGARRVLHDPGLRYDVYQLDQPLEPGDSMHLTFDVVFEPRGFRNDAQPTAVVANGTHFDRLWLPFLGYQPRQELTDAVTREEHGLPPRAAPPSPYDTEAADRARMDGRGLDPVQVNAVIGTDGAQTAITVGTLVKQWRQNGRRYFHYRTETPLPFASPVLSARYAVRKARWRDVDLRVYHHPTHDVNVDRMLRAMQKTLEYSTREFGPYPFRELNIVEFPRYLSFARAHPHTIAFSEGGAFLTRVDPGDLDRTFFVAAHETAHQWWGGQVMGAQVRGGAFLSETLAQYAAMMVMEEELGPQQARGFYDYEMDLYLRSRSVFSTREVPLLEVDGQRYIHYMKGAVAMYTLREHIGAERVNLALRRFLEKHRGTAPPFPTSLDLYAELQAVTPDALHGLLHDLFAEVTLWDVRADGARVQPTADGRYSVTLDVTARKVRADSTGNETEVPMDDLVEIGIYGEPTETEADGAPLYLSRHRIRSGNQTVTAVVASRPLRAGIDPLGKLIQREKTDNLVDVVEARSSGARDASRS
jgi:ABC-2 type transport system permease protein